MDFRQALLIIFAFGFLAPSASYALACDSGTLDTTCIISAPQTASGTASGSGNLILNSGVTLTVPAGSSLTIALGGSVSILGTLSGAGSAGGSCSAWRCGAGAGTNGAAISISASAVTLSGSLTTSGGNGGYGGSNSGYGGPGGSAGSVSISAGKVIFTSAITSTGGAGGSSSGCSTPCPVGGSGGNGGAVSVSAGSTVFNGTVTATGGSPGTGQGGSGGTGAAGAIAVIYGQFYSGSGSYSPKMRFSLVLANASSSPIAGIPLKLYQNGTNATAQCSGTTDAGGLLTCSINTSSPVNLDLYATGGGPKDAKLTVMFFNASNNTVDTYLGASGDRKIAELRLFAANIKDFSGAGVDGGRLTVMDQNGNTVCDSLSIKQNSTVNGDAYCRVIGTAYPAVGKRTLKYGLSVDTNGAYQDIPVAFNGYVARDDMIYINGAHKYLPGHTAIQFIEKTPIEIRYFPSSASQDFIFNDSIPSGFSFSGAVLLTKHTSGGSQSCSYSPSGTEFSIGSAQCSMLSSSISPGGWFELAYNTTAPSVPPNTTVGYSIPSGIISYLS